MDLQTLTHDYATAGFGEELYREAQQTVYAVVRGRRYPVAYSPTGQWDEDAFSGLTHDWVVNKLLRSRNLEHLLLTNDSLRGFRVGLQLSFTDFLIGQKKRTALDNLFARAAAILEGDARFRLFIGSRKKAARYWGLALWTKGQPYQGSEADLIAAGLRLQGIRVIRYRADARKHSPVVSDGDLGELLAALLVDIDQLLSLAQFSTIFAYRFDLLEARNLSLEQPISEEAAEGPAPADLLYTGQPSIETQMLVDEAVADLLPELSARQRRALLAYTQLEATLTSVAEELGCSKSTVDNELRRALQLIRRRAEDAEEAHRIYAQLLERLNESHE